MTRHVFLSGISLNGGHGNSQENARLVKIGNSAQHLCDVIHQDRHEHAHLNLQKLKEMQTSIEFKTITARKVHFADLEDDGDYESVYGAS